MGGKRARASRDGSGRPSKNRAGKRRRGARAADSPDEVICQLCGRGYRAIRVLHLRRVHGFDGDHPVEDYKRRFGLRVAACRDTCRTLAEHRIRRAERAGRHWTEQRIVTELRRLVRAGEPIAASRLDVPFYQSVRRRFGTWTRAVQAAGLDPGEHRRKPRWDKRRLAKAIRERRAAGKPLFATRVKREQPEAYMAAIRLHGSWGAALRANGLSPAKHRMPSKWSLAKAREWVRARRRAGRPITAGHVPAGLHSRVTCDVPGGWTAFVESLGIRYPGVKRRRWTDAQVLTEIRKLRRRGQPLNVKAVRRAGNGALEQQARKRFGSWDQALRAAGIDPARIRRA